MVGLLVSDRHDNIGMDPVARAIADAGRATFLIDAGDDTSTGGAWEAFSLESLEHAFEGFDDRFPIAGNHDNGDLVAQQAEGSASPPSTARCDGPGGIRLLGVSDPRSSGLGSWRDERASLSPTRVAAGGRGLRPTPTATGSRPARARRQQRREALARGCVDLVLAGHLHEQVGPDRVTGSNGKAGDLHQRHDRRGGVRRGARQQAPPRRRGNAGDRPRRRVQGLQPVTIDTTGASTCAVLGWAPPAGTGRVLAEVAGFEPARGGNPQPA